MSAVLHLAKEGVDEERALLDEQPLVVDAGLDLGHLPSDHRLRSVLKSALKKAGATGEAMRGHSVAGDRSAFDAAFFGLERVKAFAQATEAQKRATLARASDALLEEAYFIEQLGLAFGSKMVLMADTVEERALYAQFTADEGRHLAGVAAHLEAPEALKAESPFHHLLAEVIAEGDRASLVFVIQVVLEGWGLIHYRNLHEKSRWPSLNRALRDVLEDEARHHGTGRILLEERGLPEKSRAYCTAVLGRFLHMVRCGPLGTLGALERALGGFDHDERIEVLSALDAEAHAAERLSVLRRLMSTPAVAPVLAELEAEALFTPLSLADMAEAAR